MKKIKKIILILLIFVLVSQPILSALFIPTSAAEVGNFDNTAIEDDLKNVDLKNYPQNSLGEVDIISFMEYGYSEQSYIDKYFGIYVYVYNPTGKPITLSGNNYVELGFYENGATTYESVKLQYLDRTSDNLIYKFKLDQSARILASARSYAAENDGNRCYEISDIQFTANSLHADVSKKYVWSGYAAYCGPDSSPDSTLTCLDYGLKSIYLNLINTNYRYLFAGSSVLYYDLNSVYFSVPEEYFNEFGNLYEMSAQWYEYLTSPMYVTNDLEAYKELSKFINISINQYGQPIDANGNVLDKKTMLYYRVLYGSYTTNDEYQFGGMSVPTILLCNNYTSGFNAECRNDINDDSFLEWMFTSGSGLHRLDDNYKVQNRIDWLFYSNALSFDGAYEVSSDRVKRYMDSYSKKYSDQELILGKYPVSLFDLDRSTGYVKRTFSINEDYDPQLNNLMVKYEKNNDNFLDWLFGGYEWKSENFSPIEIIQEGDLHLSEDEFAERYFVGKDEVSKIMSSAREAYNSGDVPFMLRFSHERYYTSPARFDYAEESEFSMSDVDGYVAQETVYLDFDVLSLTFQNEDGFSDVVIPLVAEPIDIINGLTPPDSLVLDEEERWQMLVGLLLFIIVLFVGYVLLDIYVPWLAKIMRWVVGAFWWLFTSLVKLITWPFRVLFDNATYQVKRTLKIRSPRRSRRGKRRRSRPSGNSRFWQKTVDDLKSSIENGKVSLRNSIKKMFNNKKE